MAYGVTSTGFIKKDFDTILAENIARFQDKFGNDIDLDVESPLGMLNDVLSYGQSLLWDSAEGVYNSAFQQYAEGVPLDNAMALTNNTRLKAVKSNVIVTITGTASTIIPVGFKVSKSGDSTIIFETLTEYTIASGGTVDVTMIATEFGPKEAAAGTLVNIDTPIIGVTSVTNATDAIIGRDEETDAEFKVSARNNKQKTGTSPIEGIRKAILDLDNISQCIVVENDTDVVDGDGRDPHSIEVIVQGGDDDEIAQAIFDSKASGIKTFGSTTKTIVDTQGISHDINFNRPTSKPIYIVVNITPNTDPYEGSVYPVDGDDQIKDAILAFSSNYLIGRDVLKDGENGLSVPVNSIAGIRAAEILFGLSAAPSTSTPVVIGTRELATFTLAKIEVNS